MVAAGRRPTFHFVLGWDFRGADVLTTQQIASAIVKNLYTDVN